ncbi:ribosomal-processing cysteine protease Prp [Irregularibacter muris]|uniref:Ribosomal processing cysteine protease Prp n=1 Tax=Irregularibacter muris TaxID=1796619 RepID=A0AAE3L049_9FIRM|nr:ribosomal-processing cysteine protease Prp [Irregularibacter muris]MCR1900225.1 ribosomal-processing cysteine protease Prp [Irregularibacter muris]
MISITLWENRDLQIEKFLIEGHAGSGEYGWDIVCAAVSALTIATLNGLTEYVGLPLDFKLEEGYVHCKIPKKINDRQMIQSQAILKTMDLAFQNIVNEYKEYVQLKRVEI